MNNSTAAMLERLWNLGPWAPRVVTKVSCKKVFHALGEKAPERYNSTTETVSPEACTYLFGCDRQNDVATYRK